MTLNLLDEANQIAAQAATQPYRLAEAQAFETVAANLDLFIAVCAQQREIALSLAAKLRAGEPIPDKEYRPFIPNLDEYTRLFNLVNMSRLSASTASLLRLAQEGPR